MRKTREVTYVHLLLDGHEVLCANGAPAESLYLGEQTLRALPADQLAEIRIVMPHYFEPTRKMRTAYPLPVGRRQKRLVDRHAANRQTLLGKKPEPSP